MESSNGNGTDEAGHGNYDREDFHDAEDGNCITCEKNDESDALGKVG